MLVLFTICLGMLNPNSQNTLRNLTSTNKQEGVQAPQDPAPQVAGDLVLSNANASFIGQSNFDYTGSTVANAGDVNKDGFDDILIGTYYTLSNRGKVFLLYGHGPFSETYSQNLDLETISNASFIGEDSGNWAGFAVDGAGDINKDGYADILIGAPGYNSYYGKVYIVYGNGSLTKNMSLAIANASFIGEWANGQCGRAASGVGDVNHDGYADILIGAPYYAGNEGKVYLIYGRTNLGKNVGIGTAADATFTAVGTMFEIGTSVAGGNINNDTYDDLLIGGMGDELQVPGHGRVYVVLGNSSLVGSHNIAGAANASFLGENVGDYVGHDFAYAGDLNNDTYGDILIGAYNYTLTGNTYAHGKVYVVFGNGSLKKDMGLGAANISFIGENARDEAGFSLAGAGDVNGDGLSDILVGAHYWSDGTGHIYNGRAYLIYGNKSLTKNMSLGQANVTYSGESFSYCYTGESVACGDFNGDGRGDVLIGADGFSSAKGKTYLIYGPLDISKDIYPPTYSNLTEITNPLELGNTLVIRINVSDPAGSVMVNQSKIEYGGENHSMSWVGGIMWEYAQWAPTSTGIFPYTIHMQDKAGNWNLTTGEILVEDTTSPTFSDLTESAETIQISSNETISIEVFDSPGTGVKDVKVEYENAEHVQENHTMIPSGGDTWTWGDWKVSSCGVFDYTIYMEDNAGNLNSTAGTITVVSTNAPRIENLTKGPADPVELGNTITVWIDVCDNETSTSTTLIELGNKNYTMTNSAGNTWDFIFNMSVYESIGRKTFTIFANDTEDNWNSFTAYFDVEDKTPPNPSNLAVNADIIELGNNVTFSVNITDLGVLKEVLLEIGGGNHSMTDTGGNIWQFINWTPTTIGNYPFTIYIKDYSNNRNTTTGSILVWKLFPPTIINGPVGNVISENITFSWEEGYSPYGIASYRLIISTEDDPTNASAFIIDTTLMNNGPNSHNYTVVIPLSGGQYYYFLYQVDGVGHQSNFAWGTFTVVEDIPWFLIILIIVIIVTGLSASILVLERRKVRRDFPQNKLISLKLIIGHINDIPGPLIDGVESEQSPEEKVEKGEEEGLLVDTVRIQMELFEIQQKGEELYAEGNPLIAQKYYLMTADLLHKLGRTDEAQIYSELAAEILQTNEIIQQLSSELVRMKGQNDHERELVTRIELIALSKKINERSGVEKYQSEILSLINKNQVEFAQLEQAMQAITEKANQLENLHQPDEAKKLRKKTEIISAILVRGRNNGTKDD